MIQNPCEEMFGGGLRVQTPTHKVFGRLGNGLFLDLQNDALYACPSPPKINPGPSRSSLPFRREVELYDDWTRLDSIPPKKRIRIQTSKLKTSVFCRVNV